MPSLHGKNSQDDGVIGLNEALGMSSESESNKPRAIAVDLDFKPNLRFYLSFVAISSLTLAAAIDATSVSNVLPIMTKDLQGSSIEAFWTGTSFLISSAIVMPIYATLSHVFGRKLLMHISAILFFAGTVLGARASNMVTMLSGRTVQGIGAGGAVVLGEIIISDLVPLKERGKWLGWLGSMWTIGGLIGPLAGSVLAQYAGWPWIFWILLPFIGFGSFMLQLFLKQEAVPGGKLEKVLRVDWTGALLFMISTAAILVPLTCGGIALDWNDWRLIVPVVLGSSGLGIFVCWEIFIAREPMIRVEIFSNWTLRSTYLQTVLHAIVFWAMFYYLPLYYQVIKQYSVLISGVAMLPETLIVSPMSVIIGFLHNRSTSYRWAVYAGWIFMVVGTGLLILLDVHTPIVAWIMINAVACIGIGSLITSMNLVVQAAANPRDSGHAVAFYVFLRQFGEGLGVAVGGAIFQNRLKQNIQDTENWSNFATELVRNAITLGESIHKLEKGPARDELVQTYANSLKSVWVLMCAISATGLALTLLIRGYSMDKPLETEQCFVKGRREDVEIQSSSQN